MITKIRKVLKNGLDKCRDFFIVLLSSLSISWKASKKFTIIRMVNEAVTAILPIIALFIGKEVINLLIKSLELKAGLNGMFRDFVLLIVFYFSLRLMSKALERVKELCGGIHKDLIGKFINIQIASKSASLDISYFDSTDFYNEMVNVRRDSFALESLTWYMISIVRIGVQFIISSIILVKLNFLFVLFLLIVSIPSIISEKKYTRFSYSWQRKQVPEERKMGYLLGVLTDRYFAKDIRLFGVEGLFLDKYLNIWNTWFKEKTRIMVKKGIWTGLVSFLPEITEMGIMIYIGSIILSGGLTVGDYSLYSGIIGQMAGGLISMIGIFSQIYDNNLRIECFNKFLKFENKIKSNGSKSIKRIETIEFSKVSFIYPGTDQYVLKGVNFCMENQKKIALVGLNGAGKSTVIKLILRFYDPTEGTILVNGTDIKKYDLKQLRNCFSVMFQDYANYAFTIRDNITLSNIANKDSEIDIFDACARSEVQSILDKFDTGLDTYLTRQFEEDGRELSGGEWQRMALARTFFSNGDLIILDEPSSSLDPEAEYKIFQKFAELCKGKGAIFISHRLSNVTMADRIIVLENGEVIEDGPHRQLMELNGRYAYLFNLQAEKYMAG